MGNAQQISSPLLSVEEAAAYLGKTEQVVFSIPPAVRATR